MVGKTVRKAAGLFLALVLGFSLLWGGSSLPVQAAENERVETAVPEAYTKRAGLKKEYQAIYDTVYAQVDLLRQDYPAGAVIFTFEGQQIPFQPSAGDTIYIPLGSLQDDHPELEWISPGVLEPVVEEATGTLQAIRLRENMTNARIGPYQDLAYFEEEMSRMDACVAEILAEARALPTEYEQLLSIHDWLVTHNEYNSYVAAGQDDLADVRAWSAMSAFLSGNDPAQGPVCEGYSEAFQILCGKLGIPCVLLVGMNHQWNAVQVDGSWYAVDCTWDDPVGGSFGGIRRDYFLVGTETRTMGGTSTYGQDHTAYETSVTPEISAKGLALIQGGEAEDAVFDGSGHGIAGTITAFHGTEELEGAFSVAYYRETEEGGWELLGEEAPAEAGRYQAQIQLLHQEYQGTRNVFYQIEPAELTAEMVHLEQTVYRHEGEPVHPEPAVTAGTQKLEAGTDYMLAYEGDCQSPGTCVLVVSGMGNYQGEVRISFSIQEGTTPSEPAGETPGESGGEPEPPASGENGGEPESPAPGENGGEPVSPAPGENGGEPEPSASGENGEETGVTGDVFSEEPPKTGDGGEAGLWTAGLLGALGACVAAVLKKSHQKNHNFG